MEDGTKMTDYSAASTVQSGIPASGFNDYDKSTKINFVSDGWSRRDSIGAQMHRLTQLINSLKATSFPHNEFGSGQRSPVHQLNLLRERIHKIMTQLTSQTPYPKTQQTNLDSAGPQTKYSTPEEAVGGLFRKYLANSSFVEGGEFVKPMVPRVGRRGFRDAVSGGDGVRRSARSARERVRAKGAWRTRRRRNTMFAEGGGMGAA